MRPLCITDMMKESPAANLNRKPPRKLKKAARAAAFERPPQAPPPPPVASRNPKQKKSRPGNRQVSTVESGAALACRARGV